MGSSARLNVAIQGVDVVIDHQGQNLRALICSNVLEERFSAEHTPMGWLTAYKDHEAEVDALVLERFAAEQRQPVILR